MTRTEAAGENSPADRLHPGEHPLADDVHALIDDGKTYLQAELQYQKSRAAFVADRGKSGAVYGIAALLVVHLALIALVVGLVFALGTVIGPWASTAVVVGVLLVGAIVLGLAAKKRFAHLATAFSETDG